MARAHQSAIVFDLDNTLVHSKIDFASIRRSLSELLLAAGVVDQPIVTEGPRRRSIGQIIQLAEDYDGENRARLRRKMWRIVERYERIGMRLATVESDSLPSLAELRRRGHALGILTNNSRTAALEALAKFKLLPHMDAVLGREDIPEMKPAPDGLIVARERLGERARRLVMVGDSYLDGLTAARAGCPFIAFRPRPGELEHHGITPFAVITALRELIELSL